MTHALHTMNNKRGRIHTKNCVAVIRPTIRAHPRNLICIWIKFITMQNNISTFCSLSLLSPLSLYFPVVYKVSPEWYFMRVSFCCFGCTEMLHYLFFRATLVWLFRDIDKIDCMDRLIAHTPKYCAINKVNNKTLSHCTRNFHFISFNFIDFKKVQTQRFRGKFSNSPKIDKNFQFFFSIKIFYDKIH